LHPKVAMWTLLKLSTFNELLEILIIFAVGFVDSILCTSHFLVIIATTTETVVLLARRAHIFSYSLLKLKDCRASAGRTPWGVFTVSLHIIIERKLVKLLKKIFFQILLYVIDCNAVFALLHRTSHFEIVIQNTTLYILEDALFVENVPTGKSSEIRVFNVNQTYLAFELFIFLLLLLLFLLVFLFKQHFDILLTLFFLFIFGMLSHYFNLQLLLFHHFDDCLSIFLLFFFIKLFWFPLVGNVWLVQGELLN
jgi:hypothetical protein